MGTADTRDALSALVAASSGREGKQGFVPRVHIPRPHTEKGGLLDLQYNWQERKKNVPTFKSSARVYPEQTSRQIGPKIEILGLFRGGGILL